MKRVSAILIIAVFLVSGMHVYFASHYCGGKLVNEKISFTGARATCGMEECITGNSVTPLFFKSVCCENHVSSFSVNDYIESSTLQPGTPGRQIVNLFTIPFDNTHNIKSVVPALVPEIIPPGVFCLFKHRSSVLCVYRI